MMRVFTTAALLATLLLQPAADPDRAVALALRQSQMYVTDVRIWRRQPVTPALDIVLALGVSDLHHVPSASDIVPGMGPLGIYVQERHTRHRVFAISVSTVCATAEILRVAASDTLLSCDGEKSEVGPYQKIVYDVAAKALVKQFSYQPLLTSGRARRVGQGLRVTVANQERALAIEYVPSRVPEFRLQREVLRRDLTGPPYRRSAPETRTRHRFGPSERFTTEPLAAGDTEIEWVVRDLTTGRRYRLPRSTLAAFLKARPEHAANLPDSTFDERIGPRAVDGDRLWFGKTFYDGEGSEGVGGIGFFDPIARRYEIYTAPLIADWSVTALHIEPDTIWLSLSMRGEYGERSGGILRFDRRDHTFQRVAETRGLGWQFVRLDDRLALVTDVGITVITDRNEIHHYIADQTTDGRLRMIEAER